MNTLEYAPNWKGNLGFSWEMTEALTLDSDLLYVGKRNYFFTSNQMNMVDQLGSYATLSASLSYKMSAQTTLEVYADNITDTKFEEKWGYPAMGFNAGVSIEWEL